MQLWDLRVKRSVQTFSEKYQVLSVAFSEAGDQVSPGPIIEIASHLMCFGCGLFHQDVLLTPGALRWGL